MATKSVALASYQSRQVLEIDVNEADCRLFEDADRRFAGCGPLVQPMPLETAVGSAAGDLGIDAAPHHLADVIERQLQLRSQLADERFLQRRELGGQPFRRVRSVGDCRSTPPTIDRRLAHPQLNGKLCDRLLAALDVSPDFRCRGSIGVQVQLHDARRSLIYEMPRSTPIPSNQSPGTEHGSGDPGAISALTRVFDALCTQAFQSSRSPLPRGRTENVAPHAFTYSIVKESMGLSDCLEAKEDRSLFAALVQGAALVSLYLPSPSKPRGSARHRANGLDYARPARERVTPGRARIAGPWA